VSWIKEHFTWSVQTSFLYFALEWGETYEKTLIFLNKYYSLEPKINIQINLKRHTLTQGTLAAAGRARANILATHWRSTAKACPFFKRVPWLRKNKTPNCVRRDGTFWRLGIGE